MTLKKKITLLSFFLLVFTIGCSSKKDLKTGLWRGIINTKGGDLPFGLDIQKNADSTTFSVFAINGSERLLLDTARIEKDSLIIPMGIFDATLKAKFNGDRLEGFYKKMRSNGTFLIGNFSAKLGYSTRFETPIKPTVDVSGKWSVLFRSSEKPSDTTLAVGIFNQKNCEVNGTFMTPTGDYRFLAGNVIGDSLLLSCFDGNHVFLFKSKVNTETRTMEGQFWSNLQNLENWTAQLNPNATLPDASQLTFLKKGYKTFDFSFPDANGIMISMKDQKFQNKVTVIQIMGSWCPNCMDETKFLSPWYLKNKDRGVEIVALGFEKSLDLAISGPKLERLKKRFSVPYDVLLAGVNDKSEASKTLPMLSRVASFPTTIFIDKKGTVRAIHTGFSGPGTGQYYDEFVSDFNAQIDKLLAEK